MNQSNQVFVEEKSETSSTVKHLSLLIITWNLHGAIPPPKELSKLAQQFSDHDVIYFLTQQCQNSLFYSFFFQSKALWEQSLENTFRLSHRLYCTEVMQGLHTGVLVKNGVKIKEGNRLKYKAGFLSIFGNKGAISIESRIGDKNIQVINCHLAAHHGENQRRNEILLEILGNIVKREKDTEVFIGGDFNYRIEMGQQQYHKMTKDRPNTYDSIDFMPKLRQDQLSLQLTLEKHFLSIFKEHPITFAPTYKIDTHSHQYSQDRIPGWTDRVFYRPNQAIQKYYNSHHHVFGSDHRPVIASYLLPIHQIKPQQEPIPQHSTTCNLI